jgi:hypothetical protein
MCREDYEIVFLAIFSSLVQEKRCIPRRSNVAITLRWSRRARRSLPNTSLACFAGQAYRLRPLRAASSGSHSHLRQHNMGAENSKPSTEVTQHVFSPYVRLRRPNGQHAMLQTRHD